MTEILRCLIIPSLTKKWLVPYAAVAEVIAYEAPEPMSNGPTWMAGQLAWHDKQIPLIYLDRLLDPSSQNTGSTLHIAIFNRITDKPLDFFGMILPTIPKMLRIKRGELKKSEAKTEPFSLAEVILREETLSIPNLEWIEDKIVSDLPH